MRSKALLLLVISFVFIHCEEDDTPFRNGRNLYLAKCSSCHMEDGRGLGALIPPLAGADYLGKNRDRLPCIIRYGITDTITVNGVQYTEQMAAIPELSDIDVANVLNYIGNSWGNQQQPYQLEAVRQLLKSCDIVR